MPAPAIPLQLRFSEKPHPVVAGWLPVGEVAEWLAEAARFEKFLPGWTLEFFPIAGAAGHPAAQGVVLFPYSGAGENFAGVPVFGARVQPLGWVAPRVLAPVHSVLNASLTKSECAEMLGWWLHFFHPSLGLTGFGENEGLKPWQLLEPSAVLSGEWMAAVPGPSAMPRLRSAGSKSAWQGQPLSAADAGDIAEQPPGQGLDAPEGGLAGAASKAAGWLGGMGADILKAAGASKLSQPLETWSRRKRGDLDARRQESIRQLLDDFGKDAAKALRRAIPTGPQDSMERSAGSTPSSQLAERDPIWNPAAAGGSRPTQVWKIPAELRLELERRYREAALREAQAGAYGRAAYIYAVLLGDWHSAALMLEEAGRYQDAAFIYLNRLSQLSRAAQCFQKGGFWEEAVWLYDDHKQWEKSGEVLMAAGEPERALSRWETALHQAVNPLERARLLETRLNDPEGALQALREPGKPEGDATPFLIQAFDLMGRHEWHDRAAAWLQRLRDEPRLRGGPASDWAVFLRNLAAGYPDAGVRQLAAGWIPWLVGESLHQNTTRQEAEKLIAHYQQSAPEDLLLARDLSRWHWKNHQPVVHTPGAFPEKIEPQYVVVLNPEIEWHSIAASPGGLHALGLQASATEKDSAAGFLVAGEILAGKSPFPKAWQGLGGETSGALRLDHVVLHGDSVPEVIVWSRSLQRGGWIPADRNSIGTNFDLLAAAPAPNGGVLILRIAETGSLLLEFTDPYGHLERSRVIDTAPAKLKEGFWHVGMQEEEIWIAGQYAVGCFGPHGIHHGKVDTHVTGLSVAPPGAPPQALVITPRNVSLLRKTAASGASGELEVLPWFFGADRIFPVATFLPDTGVVVADLNGGIWYPPGFENGSPVCKVLFPPNSGRPISVSPVTGGGFALLMETGRVFCYGSRDFG